MSWMNDEIGKRISALRKKRNLTQDQLAEQLDISIKHCSAVECGKSSLSVPKLIQLSQILNASLDYIICGNDYDSTKILPPSIISFYQAGNAEEKDLIQEYFTAISDLISYTEKK